MYDVIVIGARAAGSPLAMLLARAGLKILLIDRATFPSDTLSTHQIQLKGTAALARWGLLERVLSTNCPPVRQSTLSMGDQVLMGKFPPLDGVDAVVCPRRFILDKLLVDAAVEAGAELRQDFLVEELTSDGDKVTGIRGHSKSDAAGSDTSEQARLVVGADGKHSLVARVVQAQEYNLKPVQTCGYYTYWEGISSSRGEIHTLPHVMAGVFPTNDGLTVIYTAYPAARFPEVRKNIEASFWQAMDAFPELAEQVHPGHQAERFYGTADLPGFYRHAHGPGWALVGDAGMSLDPITGHGIGNAFCDAEHLCQAITDVFSGQADFETAMKKREQQRDADTLPMYELTSQLASFVPPTVEQRELFSALARKPQDADRFFGVITGSVPVEEFFSPSNVRSILGITGLGRVMLGKLLLRRKNQPVTNSLPEK